MVKFAVEDLTPALMIERVRAVVEGRINMLIEELRGRIGTEAFDILVEVVEAIRRGRRRSGEDAEIDLPPGHDDDVYDEWAGFSAVFHDRYCNVTIRYDLTSAHNPCQGGIYGYGPIDHLLTCTVHAFVYEQEELQHAQELVRVAQALCGFGMEGVRGIIGEVAAEALTVSKTGGYTFSRESPHSGASR